MNNMLILCMYCMFWFIEAASLFSVWSGFISGFVADILLFKQTLLVLWIRGKPTLGVLQDDRKCVCVCGICV